MGRGVRVSQQRAGLCALVKKQRVGMGFGAPLAGSPACRAQGVPAGVQDAGVWELPRRGQGRGRGTGRVAAPRGDSVPGDAPG